jgi:uncharacterized protein YllA (UPF0747 family)
MKRAPRPTHREQRVEKHRAAAVARVGEILGKAPSARPTPEEEAVRHLAALYPGAAHDEIADAAQAVCSLAVAGDDPVIDVIEVIHAAVRYEGVAFLHSTGETLEGMTAAMVRRIVHTKHKSSFTLEHALRLILRAP